MQFSRATIAIVASVLAVCCVLLVDQGEQEIVATGVELTSAKLVRNLADFKAFAQINGDNMAEVAAGSGPTEGIINSLAITLAKTHLQKLPEAYAKWLGKKLKKFPKKGSLVRSMTLKINTELHTAKGLLTVDGKWAKISGKTMCLQGTPSNWKKYMKAPLAKVVYMSKSFGKRRKLKKKIDYFTPAETKTLWGEKCVDDNGVFGRGYSMGCKHIFDKVKCHNRGGCLWQKSWQGK